MYRSNIEDDGGIINFDDYVFLQNNASDDELEIFHQNVGYSSVRRSTLPNLEKASVRLQNAIGFATIQMAQTANLMGGERIEEQIEESSRLNKKTQNKIKPGTLPNVFTNWLVKVKIIEIKYLLGSTDQVYCEIEIGGNKFYTTVKPFDSLKFNEARLNFCYCKQFLSFRNLLIFYIDFHSQSRQCAFSICLWSYNNNFSIYLHIHL